MLGQISYLNQSALNKPRALRMCMAIALTVGAFTVISLGPGLKPTGAASTTLTLGEICECTGPQGNGYLSTPTITAWEHWVNDHGGVDGHPVNVIVMDDGANPSTSIAAAHTLVTSDHVLAIIDNTNEDSGWISFVAHGGTPIIGGQISPSQATTADMFDPGTGYNYSSEAQAYAVKLLHAKKVAMLYCAEAPACQEAVPSTRKELAKEHIDLSYAESISYSAPSYVAQCLAAKATGATVMLVADAPFVITKAAMNCASQGYDPIQVSGGPTPQPSWPSISSMNGNIDTASEAPALVHPAAAKTFFAALDKSDPGFTSAANFGQFALETWNDLALFQAAASRAHFAGTPTAAEVKAGIYALPKGTTLGGLTPPLSFVKGQPYSSPCFFLYKVSNGKFEGLDGLKPVCLSKSGGTGS
jgi:branched-chain amino acid transport system substrate-binding protein